MLQNKVPFRVGAEWYPALHLSLRSAWDLLTFSLSLGILRGGWEYLWVCPLPPAVPSSSSHAPVCISKGTYEYSVLHEAFLVWTVPLLSLLAPLSQVLPHKTSSCINSSFSLLSVLTGINTAYGLVLS